MTICESGHTCIKKSTRNTCILCFADVKAIKKKYKTDVEFLKFQHKIRMEEKDRTIEIIRKKHRRDIKILQDMSVNNGRNKFKSGIAWGVGITVVAVAVIFVAILIPTAITDSQSKQLIYREVY